MTHSPLSRLATEVLAEEQPSVPQPSSDADVRAIHALEVAIHGVGRRRRLVHRALAGALAAAATIALVVGWRVVGARSPHAEAARALPSAASTTLAPARASSLTDGAIIVRGGRESALSDSVGLEPRDRIVTAQAGRAAITLASGTHMVVTASSDLTVAEQGATTAFALTAGSVHADVAKLRAGERFVVRTPDGEVEVRGTSFDVAVVAPSPSCGGGTTTRVAVSEGVVVVRSAGGEDRVARGESWPRGCATAVAAAAPHAVRAESPAPFAPAPSAAHATNVAPSPAPLAVAPPAPLPAPPIAAAPAIAPIAAAPVAASSDLAAQNALFAEASAARRRGDAASALAAYDRLAARYPSSPLAESAYVERMRMVAATDPRRGAEAARLYLARYPHGFARSEADDFLAKQP